MRVLFVQATPVPLPRYSTGHAVRTAAQEGWDQLRNGDLLEVAEAAGFELLITTDQNMRYQQNLSSRRIALVILGKGNWPLIRPHVLSVVAAVNQAVPGSFAEVSNPFL